MKKRELGKSFISNYIILIFILLCKSGLGQETVIAKAMQLFENQKYSDAEPLFKQLLEKNPGFIMLNYYYGACRTENGHFGDEDLDYLIKVSDKSEPARINYYLGIQYHARNNWDRAITYYSLYSQSLMAEGKKDLQLTEKINLCRKKENPFLIPEPEKIENKIIVPVKKDTIRVVIPTPPKPADTIKAEVISEIQIKPDTIVAKPAVIDKRKLVLFKTINYRINDRITYVHENQFSTLKGKEQFQLASQKQKLQDSLHLLTEKLRSKYFELPENIEKTETGKKIIDFENQLYLLQKEIFTLNETCLQIENEYWNTQTEFQIQEFVKDSEKYISTEKASESKKDQDSENEEIDFANLSLFKKKKSDQQIANEKKISELLVYKVQIGVYKPGKIPIATKKLFEKLSMIRKIENFTNENGFIVYSTGILKNQEDAEALLIQLKTEGIKEGLVVSYYNGKRISLDEADKLLNKNR